MVTFANGPMHEGITNFRFQISKMAGAGEGRTKRQGERNRATKATGRRKLNRRDAEERGEDALEVSSQAAGKLGYCSAGRKNRSGSNHRWTQMNTDFTGGNR